MPCIDKIYSVSVLVGSDQCNGNCSFCSGRYLRDQAQADGDVPRNLEAALRLSSKYGGWSVSITSSGEPTLSPNSITNVLKTMRDLRSEGVSFPFVNLFTNGITMADDEFVDKWLPLWKDLGLTAIAVSVHGVDEQKQVEAYGLKHYPSFHKIFDNIRRHGLVPRATLLLRKGGVDDAVEYERACDRLIDHYDLKMITSWPLAKPDGSRASFTPSRLGLLGIRWWLFRNAKRVLGHAWGGSVYDYRGRSVRMTSYVSKHKPNATFIRQLVVFQDGRVAYSWFQEGAYCIA